MPTILSLGIEVYRQAYHYQGILIRSMFLNDKVKWIRF